MFRFTIRDVLWLMVVVGAVCIAWFSDSNPVMSARLRELEARSAELEAQIKRLKGVIVSKNAMLQTLLYLPEEESNTKTVDEIRQLFSEQLLIEQK